MALHCHDMKKGDVFACEECGLQLKVVEECATCGLSEGGECGCNDEEGNECTFSCCGQDLVKQK